MAEKEPVATIKVRGVDYPVTLSANTAYRSGKPTASFVTKVGDASISSETLEGLYDKTMAQSKRQAVKVAVPFTAANRSGYYGNPGVWRVRRGTLTGIHAGSGSPLIRWDDGATEQGSGYGGYLTRLSAEDEAKYLALKTEGARLDKEIYDFENAHRLDARAAIEAAIAAATSGMED